MKKALSKRREAVIEVISKPKTPSEIREQVGLSRGNNISSTLRDLVAAKVLHKLNTARTGQLYGLTDKGKRLKKRLSVEKGMPFSYTEPRPNWNLYAWVICGKQRKAILRAMKSPMPLKYIKERAQQYNPRISRMNANDVLQLFVRRGIALKSIQYGRVFFSLTRTGEAIRNQLLQP